MKKLSNIILWKTLKIWDIFFVENIKKMRNIISWKTFPAESCPLKVPPGSRMGRKSLG